MLAEFKLLTVAGWLVGSCLGRMVTRIVNTDRHSDGRVILDGWVKWMDGVEWNRTLTCFYKHIGEKGIAVFFKVGG